MRKSEAGDDGFRTTEQRSNNPGGRSRFYRVQWLLSVGFLVCGIGYALTALFLPQFLRFQGPKGGWLSAHRIVEVALAIALSAAWWGLRIRLSNAATSRAKDGNERLRLK